MLCMFFFVLAVAARGLPSPSNEAAEELNKGQERERLPPYIGAAVEVEGYLVIFHGDLMFEVILNTL